MAIRIKLDEIMKKEGKSLTELAGEIDITLANLSILKNNKDHGKCICSGRKCGDYIPGILWFP